MNEFSFKKRLVYFANKSDLNTNLGLIIKRVKFKHNNVFVNKPMNMRLDLIIFLKIYLYRLEIETCKFANSLYAIKLLFVVY